MCGVDLENEERNLSCRNEREGRGVGVVGERHKLDTWKENADTRVSAVNQRHIPRRYPTVGVFPLRAMNNFHNFDGRLKPTGGAPRYQL